MIKRSLLWALLLALTVTGAQALDLLGFQTPEFPHEAGLMRAENPAGEERWLSPEEALPEGFEVKEAVYLLRFTDSAGNPLPGVMVSLCTDTLCQNVIADEMGEAWLLKPPAVYEVHVVTCPDGVWHTPATGGETVIQLTEDK